MIDALAKVTESMPDFRTPPFTNDVSANWMGRDIERESRYLRAAAETKYPHRSGIGDHREEILTDFLERRLPETIRVCKGHVADSCCRQTTEFDVILYDAGARLLVASGPEGRAIVPVEAIRACIEVRTILDRRAIADTNAKSEELRCLKRRFLPTHLGTHLLPTLADTEIATMKAGIPSCDFTFAIPPVPILSFAYDSISTQGVADAYREVGPYVWSATAIGCLHAVRLDKTNVAVLETGHLSLVYFLQTLVKYLEMWQSRAGWVQPDWERYFLNAAIPE